MSIERKQFVDALQIVAPALSDNDLIPILSHVCFTGEEIFAYNDQIGISTSLKTDYTGALPGNTLIAMMKSSKAKKVSFEVKKNHILIHASRSDLRLACLNEDSFSFDMPELEGSSRVLNVNMSEFFRSIELCLRSVGNDVSVPDMLGISLIVEDDNVLMFSTNSITMTMAKTSFEESAPFEDRVILSAAFCQQMLKISSGYKAPKKGKDKYAPVLEIADDYALFVYNDIHLFGRLIESDSPLNFQEIMDHHLPNKVKKHLVPIPSAIGGILERAVVITDGAVKNIHTVITVEDGVMEFFSSSERGEIMDDLQILKNHPSAEINIEAKYLKSAYGLFDNMLINDTCAIMEKDGTIYMVAAKISGG